MCPRRTRCSFASRASLAPATQAVLSRTKQVFDVAQIRKRFQLRSEHYRMARRV